MHDSFTLSKTFSSRKDLAPIDPKTIQYLNKVIVNRNVLFSTKTLGQSVSTLFTRKSQSSSSILLISWKFMDKTEDNKD